MLKAIMIVIVAVSVSAVAMGQPVAMSGVTKDCSNDQEFPVSNIDVFAFEPAVNHHMVDLLRSMDTVSFGEYPGEAVRRFNTAYWQLDSLLTRSAVLAKTVTNFEGAFRLTVPAMDSVLVLAHATVEDEPFYYSYTMVAARAGTAVILDMRRGQCGFAHVQSSDAALPGDVMISGIATDCVGSEVYPIDGLGIWAFDPITDQNVVKVLRSIGNTDFGTDSGVARFNSDYLKLQHLLATSTALARDTTTATGAFSLTVPARDSVLVLGFTEPEGDTYYFRWQMVGGRSNSVLTLDMSAGECFPSGAARQAEAERVVTAKPLTPCRGPDQASDDHIWLLQQAAAQTDNDLVANWAGMGFLSVSAEDITLVTDSTVCASVVQAYNAAADLNPPKDPPVDSLYVIRVGPRYDGFDPAVRAGEFVVHRVFDTTFTHLDTHFR